MGSHTKSAPAADSGAIITRLSFEARRALLLYGPVRAAEILIDNQREDRDQLLSWIEKELIGGRLDADKAEAARVLLTGDLPIPAEAATDGEAVFDGSRLAAMERHACALAKRFAGFEAAAKLYAEVTTNDLAAVERRYGERLLALESGAAPVAWHKDLSQRVEALEARTDRRAPSAIPTAGPGAACTCPTMATGDGGRVIHPPGCVLYEPMEAPSGPAVALAPLVAAVGCPRVTDAYEAIRSDLGHRLASMRRQALERLASATRRYGPDTPPQRRALVEAIEAQLAALVGE